MPLYDAEYYTKVSKGRGQMPAVFIIYDMFSLAVAVTDSRRSLAHFLVRVCAVLGGVFAVSRASLSPSDVRFLDDDVLVRSARRVASMLLLHQLAW
jgi:Endoplasmic reticulum vesicle transporter